MAPSPHRNVRATKEQILAFSCGTILSCHSEPKGEESNELRLERKIPRSLRSSE